MASISSPAVTLASSSLLPDRKKLVPSCMPGIPNRWFFPTEKLNADNPSLRSGVDLEKELSYRQQAACFIQDLGIKLHLPHWVINVAVVYMHRFYALHSFKRFPRNDLAAAALFLAAKVEEMPRKLEHIVKISYALQHREEPPLDALSDKYMEEAQKVATFENVLLLTLGFDLNVEVPNTFVVKRVQLLNAPKSLAFAAYHFTTDSLHLTTLCLRYRPSIVACACIYLACDWAKWEIPSLPDGRPWFSVFDPEATSDVLKVLSDELVKTFQRCPERLRNKRHIATLKRDSNGVVLPASIMDRNNGISLVDLHNGVGSVSFPTSLSSFASPSASALPGSGTKRKMDSDSGAKRQSSTGNVEGNVKSLSVQIQSTSDGGVSASVIAQGIDIVNCRSIAADVSKKPRQETSKVDLKSYKERLKERSGKPETMADGNQQLAPARKSFIPDVSAASESWLFPSASGDHSKESTSATMESASEQGKQHRHSSRDRQQHHGHSSQGRRHRHEEKKPSERSSSLELCISLKDSHRHRDSATKAKHPSPSSNVNRSRTSQPNSEQAVDHAATPIPKTSQAPTVAVAAVLEHTSTQKRPATDEAMDNGPKQRDAKLARVIDYEHRIKEPILCDYGSRTVVDYDHGKVVTDYGHGDSLPHTQYFTSSDSGYSDAKGFSSSSASSYASSTVVNGATSATSSAASANDVKSKVEQNESSSSSRSSKDVESKREEAARNNTTSMSKAKRCGGLAIDRHFKSVTQSICKIPVSKPDASTTVEKEMCTSIAGVSSIVGIRLPDDDILRQAALKAEQMQKRERLEKLKNTKFADFPGSSMNLPSGGLTRPMKTSPGEASATSRSDLSQ